jgi:tetratricopeptide (TPR) repeat protein
MQPGRVSRRVLLAVLFIAIGGTAMAWWRAAPPAPAGLDEFDPMVARAVRNALWNARIQPWSTEAILELGMVYEANEVPELAVNCYERVAARRPNDANVWYRLACAIALTGDVPWALENLDKAEALDARYVPLHWRRGEWLLEQGATTQAREAFLAALEIDNRDRAARTGLATCMLQQGEVDQAIEILQRLAAHRDDRHAQRMLGAAYLQAGRHDEALVQMHLAGESTPQWLDPWSDAMATRRTGLPSTMVTIEERFASGRHAEGLQLLESLATEFPENSAVMYATGVGCAHVGRIHDARGWFERAMTAAPLWALPPSGLAAVHHSRREFGEALQWIDRAIELNPRLGVLHTQRGQALLEMGRSPEAMQEFERAFELEPGNVQPLVFKGRAQLQRADAQGAKSTFERAVQRNPTEPSAQSGLAEACLELDDVETATEALQAARRLNPAEPGLDSLQQEIDRRRQSGGPAH